MRVRSTAVAESALRSGRLGSHGRGARLELWARRLPARFTFVGGHPLGGAPKGGLEHARPDLFSGRPWLFTPSGDGPNPKRAGNRNNVGDVWVVAELATPDPRPLRARAHLLVTVPLYMAWFQEDVAK